MASNQGNQGGNQGNQGGKGQNEQSGDTSNRGFASMDPQQQREIAAEGGRAAQASGNAHEFTSEEAREAGRMSHQNDGNRQSGGQGQAGGAAGGSGSSGGGQGGNQQSGSGGRASESGSGSGGNQGSSGGVQGGTPEQHAEAGRQSHKND